MTASIKEANRPVLKTYTIEVRDQKARQPRKVVVEVVNRVKKAVNS